jgi:hypothetical protein
VNVHFRPIADASQLHCRRSEAGDLVTHKPIAEITEIEATAFVDHKDRIDVIRIAIIDQFLWKWLRPAVLRPKVEVIEFSE